MEKHKRSIQGVLVLRGQDRRNTLQHALDFLTERPSNFTSDYAPCDINLSSARGFGEYGGVLIRFYAPENVYRVIASTDPNNPLQELNKKLNQEKPVGDELMEARVYKASEFFAHDPRVTHQTFTRTGVDPKGESFKNFLAILSADPNIDIASYDSVMIDEDTSCEGWRVYDLAGRGSLWLRSMLDDANRLSQSTQSNTQRYPAHEDVRIEFPLMPLDFQQFARSTTQLATALPESTDRGYLYFRVHCQDFRGLFTVAHRFARTATAETGTFTKRTVVRSSCAGIGGRAISIVATIHDGTENLEDLEKQLQAMIRDEMKSKGIEKIGDIDIRISSSIQPPTTISNKDEQSLVTVNFESKDNKPKILQSIIKAASAVEAANPSVYFLSSRLKDTREPSTFACAIGWLIEPKSLFTFQAAIDAVIQKLCHADHPPVYSPHWDRSMQGEVKNMPSATPTRT